MCLASPVCGCNLQSLRAAGSGCPVILEWMCLCDELNLLKGQDLTEEASFQLHFYFYYWVTGGKETSNAFSDIKQPPSWPKETYRGFFLCPVSACCPTYMELCQVN